MSFETKVIYATDSHFTNPTTVAESGTPSSVTLQQLTPNQQYYTKAQIWNDGSMDDESSTEYFTTIPAGTITLTYIQTVRSGYGYDVSYRYTSTYAPSYATLSTNGSTFQGFIDSAQNVVSFWVTGLTSGEAYLTSVTLGDIYGETETVTGSIITTVVNEVHITGTEPSETSIDVDIAYVLDGGFWQGYIDYWLASQDPETEPSQGHTYFNDGADTVTMSGLSPETAYKFRVTITLSDMTTEIESNMVTASTTAHDYSNDYFTIENLANRSNTITLKTKGNAPNNTVYYSTNNGSTWTSIVLDTTGYQIVMSANDKVQFKGDNVSYIGNSPTANNNTTIICSDDFKMYGNIASLLSSTNFVNVTSIPDYWQTGMFNANTHLLDASGLYFPDEIGEFGCIQMFLGCTALRTPPTMSNVTTLDSLSLTNMFYGCTSLESSPDLSKITSVEYQGMMNMFRGCTSLSRAVAPTITWNTSNMENWLRDTAASGVLYADSSIANTIPTETNSGCPSGWTIQRL